MLLSSASHEWNLIPVYGNTRNEELNVADPTIDDMESGNKRYYIRRFFKCSPFYKNSHTPKIRLLLFSLRFNYTFRSPDVIGASYTSSWQDHPYFVESGNKVEVPDTFNAIDRKCNGDLSRYAYVVREKSR